MFVLNKTSYIENNLISLYCLFFREIIEIIHMKPNKFTLCHKHFGVGFLDRFGARINKPHPVRIALSGDLFDQ